MSSTTKTTTNAAAEGDFFRARSPTYRFLLREAMRIVGSPADAEDVVQDCITRLLESERAGERPANPRAWLTTAVRRRSIDLVRYRSRQRLGSAVAANSVEDASWREEQPTRVVTAEQLSCALGGMPAASQQIIDLRYIQKLSYRQLTVKLNLSAVSVGVRLHRARSQLRALLAQLVEAG